LFGDEPDADRLRDHTVTFAELLTEHTPGWQPPTIAAKALTQVHCHQHAIMKWDADSQLLKDMGVDAERLDSGCCGLAGNFGFEPGHAEVSEACAESVLLPRIREAAADTLVLADGFSCRTQIDEFDSGGRRAAHLAEVLAAALHGIPVGPYPERTITRRP
jgi:Fe-S oxidoreductase